MLRILKIYNNNVALAKDSDGSEVVIMGRGLAHQTKLSDEVPPEKIDKVFHPKTKTDSMQYIQLLESIPPQLFQFTEKWVEHAEKQLNRKLQSGIFITLTDHLNTMLARAKAHAYIKNTMLWDIRHLYREEFLLAREIVEDFNQTYNTVFDDNEAAFIALHFVNASIEGDFSTTTKITKLIGEILSIIKYNFHIVFDEDSFSYNRLLVHLRFFAQRIFAQTSAPPASLDPLQEYLASQYQDAYACAQIIEKFINQTYGCALTQEECSFLTIHIVKVVSDSKKLG